MATHRSIIEWAAPSEGSQWRRARVCPSEKCRETSPRLSPAITGAKLGGVGIIHGSRRTPGISGLGPHLTGRWGHKVAGRFRRCPTCVAAGPPKCGCYTVMCCECAIRNRFGRLGRKKTVHHISLLYFHLEHVGMRTCLCTQLHKIYY